MGPPEKKAPYPACGAQRDTFSGPVSGRESQNCGDFSQFWRECSRVSLQPRLCGGEGGIRTLGTGLNGVRADVYVSYRESIFYPETEGLMPLRHWGKPAQFPVQSKGEWLAILRLKVVSTTPLKLPDCFAPDCVRAGQGKSEKYLRRMSSSKGEWAAIFRDWCPCFVARHPPLGPET